MNKLIINTDGGSRGNPGPAAIGIVIKNDQGEFIFEHGEKIGVATNNQAEHKAALFAMEWLINYSLLKNYDTVEFRLDSQLVAYQLTGKYKIKNKELLEILVKTKAGEAKLDTRVVYCYVPREENKEADRILNLALDTS